MEVEETMEVEADRPLVLVASQSDVQHFLECWIETHEETVDEIVDPFLLMLEDASKVPLDTWSQ